MSQAAMRAFHPIQVAFARAQQQIGWTGLAGLALVVAATLLFAHAWMGRPAATASAPKPLTDAGRNVVPEVGHMQHAPVLETTLIALARPDEAPKLLRQLERIAVSNGLGWPAADYRMTPASLSQPTGLEVRITLKGPYPRLRVTVAQMLREVPAATLREFSLNRSSSESIDVEAKLVISVALDSGPAAIGRPREEATR